jgi:hypothetical protein
MSRRTLSVIDIMLEVPGALLPLKMPNLVILSRNSEVFLDQGSGWATFLRSCG